jgi:hypothetical protein
VLNLVVKVDIVLYKFWNDKWVETKKLTEKDIALIIDDTNKMIYIREGQLSTPRNQIRAKLFLGKKKLQYPKFKFRMIEEEMPSSIESFLKIALQDTDEIREQIEKDNEIFEKIMRGTSLIISILIIIVIGRFLGQIDNQLLEKSENWREFFPSALEFSEFIQINTILVLISSFLIIGIIVVSIILKQSNRIRFSVVSLVLIYMLLFLYLNVQSYKMIQIGGSNSFMVVESIYFNFLINSSILLALSLIFLMISIFFPIGFSVKNETQGTKTKKKRDKKQTEKTVESPENNKKPKPPLDPVQISKTKPSTTKKPATKPSTTKKPATKPSTTKKPATKPSTTKKPATKPSTTKKLATKPSTTKKPATKPSTTKKPATKPSTTKKPISKKTNDKKVGK